MSVEQWAASQNEEFFSPNLRFGGGKRGYDDVVRERATAARERRIAELRLKALEVKDEIISKQRAERHKSPEGLHKIAQEKNALEKQLFDCKQGGIELRRRSADQTAALEAFKQEAVTAVEGVRQLILRMRARNPELYDTEVLLPEIRDLEDAQALRRISRSMLSELTVTIDAHLQKERDNVLDAARLERSHSTKTIENLTQDSDQMRARLAELDRKLQETSEKLRKSEVMRLNLEQSVRERDEKLLRLNAQLDSAVAASQERHQKMDALKREIIAVSLQLEKSQTERDAEQAEAQKTINFLKSSVDARTDPPRLRTAGDTSMIEQIQKPVSGGSASPGDMSSEIQAASSNQSATTSDVILEAEPALSELSLLHPGVKLRPWLRTPGDHMLEAQGTERPTRKGRTEPSNKSEHSPEDEPSTAESPKPTRRLRSAKGFGSAEGAKASTQEAVRVETQTTVEETLNVTTRRKSRRAIGGSQS